MHSYCAILCHHSKEPGGLVKCRPGVHGGERSLLQNSMRSTQNICVKNIYIFLMQGKEPGEVYIKQFKC